MPGNLQIARVSAACGAVVRGVDLRDVDDATFDEIQRAWHEHLVLFFPNQDIDPEDHRNLARRFGPLETHPHAAGFSEALPDLTVLHSDRGGRADVWHTDVTYTPAPPIGVLVRFIKGPEIGGDTMWSNQYLAFASLSDPMRELLEGLSALHMSTIDQSINHEHPVVRVHPATGRKSLYVNRLFTRGLRQLLPGESGALLEHLLTWCERPEFTCRWRWTPGDVVLWDNRCTLHHAINDYTAERVLHRAMILGDPPVGPAPRWEIPVPTVAASSVGYEYRGRDPRGR
jgi:taurine dioxygenase